MASPSCAQGVPGRRGERSEVPVERVGLLGGTFDPPHRGHVAAANASMEALALDRLLLVVANHPWQKTPLRPITPAEDRFAMVEAMVPLIPRAEASRLELDRGGPSYTADTVDALLQDAARRGAALDLYLIVGADLVPTLDTWHRVDELRAAVTLAVVGRPHSASVCPPGWKSFYVDGGMVDVSSSHVRERLERGLPVEGLVPEEVVRVIRARGLYAVGG
jgi:nicotinate-nucleotide adenylyltransferase